MKNLVWKVLGHNISGLQLLGFFGANLVGMMIILIGIQFYQDIIPVFTANDSFMKNNYAVIAKKIKSSAGNPDKAVSFSSDEIADLEKQTFVRKVGAFTPSLFSVYASLGVGNGPGMGTEMFLEAVPDRFVDYSSSNWTFKEGDQEIPIILPRNYLNLYNLGYAQSRGLPKISEGMTSIVSLSFVFSGPTGKLQMKGRIAGFSNRLNTILVPQKFMDWANSRLATGQEPAITRLIVETGQPDQFEDYVVRNGFEQEKDNSESARVAYFLRIAIGVVIAIGIVVSGLSLYILLLGIYLILQKQVEKIDNLFLLGYSVRGVSWPYFLLAGSINLTVWMVAVGGVWMARGVYLPVLSNIYTSLPEGSMMMTISIGFALFVLIMAVDVIAVRLRLHGIWFKHRNSHAKV